MAAVSTADRKEVKAITCDLDVSHSLSEYKISAELFLAATDLGTVLSFSVSLSLFTMYSSRQESENIYFPVCFYKMLVL